MRVGVAALVIALIFSASPAIAAPNPKAGALCSKAGISKTFNDKKFTCIKRGKKLVWNAGVSIESSSTSSVFQRWERTGSQATKLFKLWTSNLATGVPKTQINYWFGSSVPAEIKTEATRRMNNVVLQWERYHKVTRSKVYFDFAMLEDHGSRCEVLSKRSVNFPLDWCLGDDPSKQNLLYWASAFESEGGWRPVLDPKLSKDASVSHSYTLFDPAVMYIDAFLPRIEHEWFHQIQYDLAGNDFLHENPMWFQEGSAEYFGLLSSSASDRNYFIQHRAQNWFAHNVTLTVDYFKEWIKKHDLPKLVRPVAGTKLPPPRAGEDTIYSYGAFLTEWMVGKIGINGVIKVMQDTENIGWSEAFKNNMGGSTSDFLTEMATYLHTEMKIIQQNNWIFLPQCKNYSSNKVIEHNKGVCNSNGSRLT